MSCPVVTLEGRRFDDLEEFADGMPEGIVLNYPIRPESCMCNVDIEATATQNGFICTGDDLDGYTYSLPDVAPAPR